MEPTILRRHRQAGWIEVICGSMFSGKTEELIRRLRRARFARQRVEIYKPAVDVRFSASEVVSHDENVLVSQPVSTASQILLLVGAAEVVGIDEAQFFDQDLVRVCRILAADGRRVIVAGLDQDYRGEPFDPVPQIMAVAEYVTKLHAICVVCGSPANHSQRIVTSRDRVLVGATEAYEPRCRDCFDPGEEPPPETPASLATAASGGEDASAERKAGEAAGIPDTSTRGLPKNDDSQVPRDDPTRRTAGEESESGS